MFTLFDSSNPGLWIVVAIVLGTVLVLSFVGLLMKRAGVSLKPLYWFAGFMALIVLPQLAGHLVNAHMKSRAQPSPATTDSSTSSSAAAAGLQTSSRAESQNSAAETDRDWVDEVIWRASETWTGLAIIPAVLLGYLLFVAAYFFKGIAWATRVGPKASGAALPLTALRERLLAINSLDVPFRVETSENENSLIASWRYADTKWIDHARAHGMRRLHRIVLKLDESNHKVRATDFATSFDWSAGGSGASLNWKFVTGVVLFQYEHQRLFGLQIDEQGQFTPALSYSYTFSLQEMKSPLAATVTQSGWTWQPVAWQAPHWLRWLTE